MARIIAQSINTQNPKGKPMKNTSGIKNFSLWCDFIERGFLQNKFETLIKDAQFVGATSNPSIFANAILHSSAYKDQIAQCKSQNLAPKGIYEALAIEDIKLAAQMLQGLYEADKDYGYISIEIDPTLCDDAKASIDEGKRLFETIGHENVMIKVPATKAGYEVMGALFAEGINVNATLIFSQDQARECAKIFDKNAKTNARAVISVFVSRFDSAISDIAMPPRLGVLNAMACYDIIESFKNPNIRTLFASTGAKLAGLTPDFYITNLITPHSVNTAPLATIDAFLHSSRERAIEWMSAKDALNEIGKMNLGGQTLEGLQKRLFDDGVVAFKNAFGELLKALAAV